MFIKTSNTKIVKVGNRIEDLSCNNCKTCTNCVIKIASNKIPQCVKLSPEKYFYIRNHSVSSLESYGPNQNMDAFCSSDLATKYLSFISQRASIDHQDNLECGMILDSWYKEPKVVAGKQVGDYVENVIVVDRNKAESLRPGIIAALEDGRITDTSMGAIVNFTICSICGNKAETPDEYCDCIANHKGEKLRTASGVYKLAYEVCKDFEFFEDSIIIPFNMGFASLAGGAGADKMAKIKQILCSKELTEDEIETKIASLVVKNMSENDKVEFNNLWNLYQKDK